MSEKETPKPAYDPDLHLASPEEAAEGGRWLEEQLRKRTADRAWAKLMEDREFVAAVPEAVRTVVREMLDDVVLTLEPHAKAPVTLASYVAAKVAVAQVLFTRHYLERMMEGLPPEMAAQRDQIVASGKQREQLILAMYAQAAVEVVDLPEGAMTESLSQFDIVLRTLPDQADAELSAGTLTIGRLLALHPQAYLAHG